MIRLPDGKFTFSDLTGKKFGLLTVIERYKITNNGHYKWLCVCDCGNTVIRDGYRLKDNKTVKSCGCLRVKYTDRINVGNAKVNLVGLKFGKWLVVNESRSDTRRGIHYLCRCDCGTTGVIEPKALVNGRSLSCGCSRITDVDSIGLTNVLCNYKRGARTRGLEFRLDENQFRALIFSNCHYCGSGPSNIKRFKAALGSDGWGTIIYNGIDRINNDIGYVPGNVVTCCKTCNYAKHNLNQLYFLQHIKRIYEYLGLHDNR